MKSKKKLIALIILVLIVAAAAVVVQKTDIISMLKYSREYTKEELDVMMKENSDRLDDEIRSYFDNDLREYTQEEKEQLENGEITSDELIARIIAEKYKIAGIDGVDIFGKESNMDKNTDTSGAATSKPAKTAEEITGQYVARLYSLQSTYVGRLDSLLNTAASEFKALPKEQRTKTKMVSIASKYIPQGYSLESNCDSQVNGLLANLEKELKAIGADTSIVSTIRSHYQAEKSIKKAYYLSLLK